MSMLQGDNEPGAIHEITKRVMPIADFLATVSAVVIWVVWHNFTAGMVVWLLGEVWRIQINQKKIIDMLNKEDK